MMRPSWFPWATTLWLLSAAVSQNPVNPVLIGPPAVSLSTGTAGSPEGSVDVALNRSGDGIVAWRQRLTPPPSPTYQIWAQPFRQGTPTGPPMPVAQTLDWYNLGEFSVVRCATDENGNWGVVWDTTDTVNLHFEVRMRRWDPTSGQLGPETVLSSPGGIDHRFRPDIAMGREPNGQSAMTVVWQTGLFGTPMEIRSRRVVMINTPAGPADVLDPIVPVNAVPWTTGVSLESPSVTYGGDGTFTFAWLRWEAWTPAVAYWRVVLRRRQSGMWLPVYDPTAPGALQNGVDYGDWEVSPPFEGVAGGPPHYPARIDAAPDGTVALAWRRVQGAPYGLRTLNSAFNAVPGSPIPYQPTYSSADFRRLDLAVNQDGSLLLGWESLGAPQISGRILMSRLSPAGSVWSETVVDPLVGPDVNSLALATADTGRVHVVWSRGSGVNQYRAWSRQADLQILAPSGTAGMAWSLASPSTPGAPYEIWVQGSPTPPGVAIDLPDGRRALVDLNDSLLQWHLSALGNHPYSPLSRGLLDGSGRAAVPVTLPPGVGPVTLYACGIILNPAGNGPGLVRQFTQPAPFVIN